MASFGVYLDSVALPIVQKVLVGLGFGAVSYVGLQAGFNSLETMFQSNMTSIPSGMAALLYLGGFNQGAGLVLAALTSRLAMTALKKFQFIGA